MSADPKNILIVEDDRQVQILYRCILPENHQVFITETVADAQNMILSQRIDCIILDIGLAAENGLALARIMRRDLQQMNIPILAVTAHAFPENRDQALAAGCDGYLTKPFGADALRSAIEDLLKR